MTQSLDPSKDPSERSVAVPGVAKSQSQRRDQTEEKEAKKCLICLITI